MIKKAFFSIILAFVFLSCSSNEKNKKSSSNNTIRIAEQYSTIYAPIYTASELGVFEKFLPDVEFQKQKFGSGAAMTEALVSGHLDIGCMGIPPALVAMNKGADFKIAFGINIPPLNLMTIDENIKTIADFGENDKIAVPGAISNNQIMLSMGAKKFLGDAKKLDKNIVNMSNANAYTALISKTDIKAHYAPLPYIEKEREAGAKSILGNDDINYKASIVCLASKRIYEDKQKYENIIKAIDKTIELINTKDENTINTIAKVEKLSSQEVLKYLDYPNNIYTTKVYGLEQTADYMLENGYIKNSIDYTNYFWDEKIFIRSEK